jgi:hypothetical protein
MNRSKRHALLFFESTATLMSNLLRTLINESLLQYNMFFFRFDKRSSKLRTPREIVDAEEVYRYILFLGLRLAYWGCIPHCKTQVRLRENRIFWFAVQPNKNRVIKAYWRNIKMFIEFSKTWEQHRKIRKDKSVVTTNRWWKLYKGARKHWVYSGRKP